MNVATSKRLKAGDRLSRSDFELLYTDQSSPKAELICGVVYVASAAVRYRQHGAPHSRMIAWLVSYASEIDGLEVGDNTSVRLDDQNEPQPDALMFRLNGNCKIAADGYLEGPPELIVEIATSSASIDGVEKKSLYHLKGVQEYLLWRTESDEIEWYSAVDGEYVRILPDSTGIAKSRVFPGLWLDVPSMISGDMKKVFNALQF